MPENNNHTPASPEENTPTAAWQDPADVPTTPIAPPGGIPAFPGNEDISQIPTTPIAPPGGIPAYPGNTQLPDLPVFPFPFPGRPPVVLPEPGPSVGLFGQVRFLNASTNGMNLDVLIDGRNVFSGSTFATVSTYIQVSDGFHTITVRRTNGQVLFQQPLAFVAGERITMVILDTANGITLAKVSDMGCTNVPSGFGCLRAANMSYAGSSYDVRTFRNQIAFANLTFREVSSYKQTSAGSYTFFVTGSQVSVSIFNELPVLVLSAILGGGSCPTCTVPNPLLTFNVNIQAGRAYTAYIIGNPWSNLYRVFVLED